jgi:hypothetical protein
MLVTLDKKYPGLRKKLTMPFEGEFCPKVLKSFNFSTFNK